MTFNLSHFIGVHRSVDIKFLVVKIFWGPRNCTCASTRTKSQVHPLSCVLPSRLPPGVGSIWFPSCIYIMTLVSFQCCGQCVINPIVTETMSYGIGMLQAIPIRGQLNYIKEFPLHGPFLDRFKSTTWGKPKAYWSFPDHNKSDFLADSVASFAWRPWGLGEDNDACECSSAPRSPELFLIDCKYADRTRGGAYRSVRA